MEGRECVRTGMAGKSHYLPTRIAYQPSFDSPRSFRYIINIGILRNHPEKRRRNMLPFAVNPIIGIATAGVGVVIAIIIGD